LLSISPGQQLVDPIDLVIGDAAKHIGQPSLRIDAVELGRLDKRVRDGSRLSSALRRERFVPGLFSDLPLGRLVHRAHEV
jgi:hypothetical protein